MLPSGGFAAGNPWERPREEPREKSGKRHTRYQQKFSESSSASEAATEQPRTSKLQFAEDELPPDAPGKKLVKAGRRRNG